MLPLTRGLHYRLCGPRFLSSCTESSAPQMGVVAMCSERPLVPQTERAAATPARAVSRSSTGLWDRSPCFKRYEELSLHALRAEAATR